MYLLPIYFTLISFILCFFFGRFINNYYAGLLTSSFIFISFIISLFIFYEIVICQSLNYIYLGDWISIYLRQIKWLFQFDSLTCIMLIIILSISSCAHIYSIEYMLFDPHQIKSMSYLSLSTFFMLLLVTSSNLIILFLGWEGVGISSYLLINFWYTRLSANKSAIMAMFVNKVGDISLLIGFTILFFLFYSFDFSIIFLFITIYFPGWNYEFEYFIYLISIFFIIGAVGKSAQLGLHTWLPEAMEGPTPVSSLIHAATMVTAGIFLIIRTNLLFQIIPNILLIIIAFGSLTAFFASTIGIFQLDIKKIIAYSTCSQLGYMFLARGLSGYQYSIYHSTNHAFFKALLFLIAGYIIHSITNEQDIRKLSGLLIILPFSYIGITIGSLSLLGFPFFSGFFSKEKIIELFYSFYFYNFLNEYLLNFFFIFQFFSSFAITFTILYSIKIIIYIFFYQYQNNKNKLFNFHYSSYFTLLPLFFLNFLSIITGYLLEDIMVGISTNSRNNSIFLISNINVNSNINYFEFNLLTNKLPIILIIYLIGLFFLLFYIYKYSLYYLKLNNIWIEFLYLFLNKKYLFFNKNIIYYLINFSFKFSYYSVYKFFDKGIIELFGPFGIVFYLNKFVNNYSKLQTGLIYHYLGVIILSIILLFLLLITWY